MVARGETVIILALVYKQGGNCDIKSTVYFPIAFPSFCGAVTLGQVYGGRSDHYGNMQSITNTYFTKNEWDSRYIAIGR